MNNLIASNIRHLRKVKGLTQDQLADKIGVNRAMIGSYEEGRAVPKLPVMQNISHYFGISIDLLINNDLSNIPDGGDSLPIDAKGANLRVVSTIVDRDDNELITLVPAKASAGYLNGYADPDYVDTLPRFSLPFQELAKERTYRAFQINGDSMDPIPSGAYIITEYVQDWHDIKDGKTYVLVTRDEGVVYKRVFLHPSGELYLKSDNPQYETYSVHLNRMLEVWKAVGYICTKLPEPDAVSLSKLSAIVMEMKREMDELKR
ncbi:MAG: LexA family transcriptional regulator [Bacteroidota bacterium]|nr:LexA family transcriptional regulator [Bacteroidota bacterium]